MIYLFVHQNFPGQYRQLVRHLADQPQNTVYFITQPNTNFMQGVRTIVYEKPSLEGLNCHPLTADFDAAVRNAAMVADVCRKLSLDGVRPDIIVGHNGWGELMFLKDVFPDVPMLLYIEFYFHASGADLNFDPEHPGNPIDLLRLRVKNGITLIGMDAGDWGNVPTKWQRSVHPPEMRSRISVIHEGVDTDVVRPDPGAFLTLGRDNLRLTRADEVVTYVSRNLEPYRGFHVFMRAAREILRRRPHTRILIVGGDEVSYGAPAPRGGRFRNQALAALPDDFDRTRIHFLGQIPYPQYLRLLQISSVHVYLTFPFVLSWSFIEAMASGCAIVGSATPPVLEVLQDGVNGLAVDFFSPVAIANRVDSILDAPDRRADLRAAARETAVRDFDLRTVTLPRWLRLLDDLIAGRRPPLYV